MQVITKKTVKPLTQLKHIHNEHYSRLQAKHAAESDLLDDVRLYCKQRAAIERDYGQALQKLANGFLCKKELACALLNDKEHSNGRSVWRVWRCLLEESNDLALARIRFGDAQQRLHSELKPLKIQRIAVCKRVFEQLRILQSDLAACVQEMVKSHKVYAEEENHAKETRLKAMATEEKIRRRSTNLFHSMAQLHRNYEKLLIRRHAYDSRSATARNEYLFQLAAINAHLKHYFTKDLPTLAKTLDGELYEKLSGVFSALGQQESELCARTKECFYQISKDATEISRAFAWESFLKSCPLFDKTVQYQFEPMDGDQNTLLQSPDSKEANLEQIARKLARRLVIRERRIKSYENELKTLQGGCVSLHQNVQPTAASPDFENNDDLLAFNQEYVEHKLEEVQFAIRREEIERVKIEACLSLLRNSAVEVKQFITEARAAADAAAAAALAQQLREANGPAPQNTSLLAEASQQLPVVRPAGEGSSDSVDSGGPISSGTDRRSYLDAQFGSQYLIGFPYSTYGYSRPNDNWVATGPRPATVGQVSNRLTDTSNTTTAATSTTSATKTRALNGTDEHVQSATWNSRDFARNSGSHDYQNVNSSRDLPRQTMDDCMVRPRRRYPSQPRRGTSSDALHEADIADPEDDDVDLESVWSEHGRLRQATVLHEFRAKRPDEVDLVVHETVVLLEKSDKNGWIKVRSLIDGNEGLVPLSFLRLHEHPNATAYTAVATSYDGADEGANSTSHGIPNHDRQTADSGHASGLGKAEVYDNFGSSPRRSHSNEQKPKNKPLKPESNRQMSCSGLAAAVSHQSSESTVLPVAEQVGHDEKSAKVSPLPGMFVRTLIEFEGCNPDELSFCPGSVIRVLGRAPIPVTDRGRTGENGFRASPDCPDRANASASGPGSPTIDDGWWEGELIQAQAPAPVSPTETTRSYRRVRGVFPSMFVQLMSSGEDCEHWSNIWEHASPVANPGVPTPNPVVTQSPVDHRSTTSLAPVIAPVHSAVSHIPDTAKARETIRTNSADYQTQSDEDYIHWDAQCPPKSLPIRHEPVHLDPVSAQSAHEHRCSTPDPVQHSPQEEVLQIAEL